MIELKIGLDGTVGALGSDGAIDLLRALGPVKAERATHVEWDPTAQTWTVYAADWTPLASGFTDRASALRWEHDHFWEIVERRTT